MAFNRTTTITRRNLQESGPSMFHTKRVFAQRYTRLKQAPGSHGAGLPTPFLLMQDLESVIFQIECESFDSNGHKQNNNIIY